MNAIRLYIDNERPKFSEFNLFGLFGLEIHNDKIFTIENIQILGNCFSDVIQTADILKSEQNRNSNRPMILLCTSARAL